MPKKKKSTAEKIKKSEYLKQMKIQDEITQKYNDALENDEIENDTVETFFEFTANKYKYRFCADEETWGRSFSVEVYDSGEWQSIGGLHLYFEDDYGKKDCAEEFYNKLKSFFTTPLMVN